MKKVGLITVHDWHNYGSMFQTYAMWKFIDSLDNTLCEVIDFIPEFLDKSNAYELYKENKLNAPEFCEYFQDVIGRKNKFDSFYSLYQKSKHKYFSDVEMEEAPPEYDVYVSGSDQIWNVNFRIKSRSYFLNFTDSKNKLAFSTSVGRCKERKLQDYSEYINDYKKIFIREESGVERVKNVTGRDDIDMMIDPTFLYDKDEWLGLAPDEHIINGKYLVCYATLESQLDEIMPIIYMLHKKFDIPVVLFGMVKPRKEDWIINKVDIGPLEFLSLYRDAEFIVTHSFHGTAFSLNLNKNFLVFNDRTHNFRKTNLLKQFNLEGRVVRSIDDVEAALKHELDYIGINEKINILRDKAKNNIEYWIGECK